MMNQGTEEWKLARLGKVTASRLADVIARTKTGYSTSRANYAAQLICERLTGEPTEAFINAAMAWGTEKEPEAREAYSFISGVSVEQVGFISHPKIAMSGASPDGLVGDDGMVEIKCPITSTHIETLLSEKVANKYVLQMQWQMACCNRAWCDFVSYDPRLPQEKRLFITRIMRDNEQIAKMEREVSSFLGEIEDKISNLHRLYPPAGDVSDFVTEDNITMLGAG